MTFAEAVAALKAGKKVKRASWLDRVLNVKKKGNKEELELTKTVAEDKTTFTVQEILATDWEIVP